MPKDEGLQGASIAKIARRIDAPPSLLIRYFGAKERMTIELVDYLLEEYRHGYGDKLAAVAADDAHELAVTVKALEEGYAFLIWGGADEAAKAEIGGALKRRALQLIGLRPPA